MRSDRKNKTNKIPLIIFFIISLGLFIGVGLYIKASMQNGVSTNPAPSEQPNENEPSSNTEEPVPEPEPEPDTFTNIRIAAAGDIMFHSTQLPGSYDAATDTYDFNAVFADVAPYFADADLAIANYETTTGGADRGFSGYPMFNSPDETIDAIKNAGIDVLTTVNNHSLDTGSKGLKRTVEVIREKGLESVGTYDEKPVSRVFMKDVKGIKVAILAYTEMTNGLGAQYGTELADMLNLMEADLIKADIKEAKELGAELIISFLHWGDEYAPEPNAKQVEYAEMMAQEGVDIILGSHPHVIQRSEFLTFNDKESFVIYSMGNFVSNQRRETLGAGYEPTEDGIIVQIDIKQNDQTREITIENVEYVPTWVYRNKDGGKSTYTYRILPIEKFLDDSNISTVFRERMKHAQDATVSKMHTAPLEEN